MKGVLGAWLDSLALKDETDRFESGKSENENVHDKGDLMKSLLVPTIFKLLVDLMRSG